MQNSDNMFRFLFSKWTFTYKLLYVIVSTGIRTFYKKYETTGIEKVPKNAGVLFAVNHQNAFMDPIVIASQLISKLNQNTYYLTRADIFKKKLAANFFKSVYMLPIYRQRDGVNTIKKNEALFNNCFDILNNKGNIIIFPEGNHSNFKKLRSLKKGIARIGFGAANKNNYSQPIYIVPIGLNYSNHTNMGATLLMNFGDPINLDTYYNSYQKNPAKIINAVMHEVSEGMEKLMLNIQSENYDVIHKLVWLLNHDISLLNNPTSSSLKHQLYNHQEIIFKVEKIEKENPQLFKILSKNVVDFTNYLEKENLKSFLFNYKKIKLSGVVIKLIFLCLTLPIHLLGLISNYLPYKIPIWLINKKIKDKHFHSSIKMALGVILFFFFWIFQSLIIGVFFDFFIAMIYLLSLPFLAWFNYHYWILFLKTKGKLKFIQLRKTEEFQQELKTYNEIKNCFFKSDN